LLQQQQLDTRAEIYLKDFIESGYLRLDMSPAPVAPALGRLNSAFCSSSMLLFASQERNNCPIFFVVLISLVAVSIDATQS
jgi:hypothetical protein